MAEFGAMRVAERSGLPVFSRLERALVFVDVPGYFEHANRAARGMVPYRDDPIEYPILALPFVFAPRLLARSQAGFVALFAAEMMLFDFALVALVACRVAGTGGLARVPRALGWLTAFFAAVAPFVMGRYDAVPSLFGFAAACSWFGARPALGGALAALGTLIKIAPGAVAVPGVASELFAEGRPRWRGTAAFVGVLAVGVASWYAIGRGGVIDSIRYHSERGVEIGSIPSGLLYAWGRAAGAEMEVVQDHQSLNLLAPGSSAASRFALPIQAAMMLLVVVAFARDRGRDPFRAAGAAVLAFAIGGKVLSPQYLIWIMPFVAAQGGPAGAWARPLFLSASLPTMILYPWGFRALMTQEGWAFAVLNLRNAALVATFAALVAFPSDRREEARAGPSEPDRLA